MPRGVRTLGKVRATRLVVSVSLTTAAVLTLGSCASDDTAGAPPPPAERIASNLPAVDVTTVLDGLDHPWDVITAPDGTIVTGERPGRIVADIDIDLPRPRQWSELVRDPRFQHYRDLLTAKIERTGASAEAHS